MLQLIITSVVFLYLMSITSPCYGWSICKRPDNTFPPPHNFDLFKCDDDCCGPKGNEYCCGNSYNGNGYNGNDVDIGSDDSNSNFPSVIVGIIFGVILMVIARYCCCVCSKKSTTTAPLRQNTKRHVEPPRRIPGNRPTSSQGTDRTVPVRTSQITHISENTPRAVIGSGRTNGIAHISGNNDTFKQPTAPSLFSTDPPPSYESVMASYHSNQSSNN